MSKLKNIVLYGPYRLLARGKPPLVDGDVFPNSDVEEF